MNQAVQDGAVLLFGTKNHRIERLERLLTDYFTQVVRRPDLSAPSLISQTNQLSLIVVTDSMHQALNADFFITLRSRYPEPKIICLYDSPTREIELAIRAAGVVFLGSYQHFSQQCKEIMNSALDSVTVNRGHVDAKRR